jgi:hypothetical protein
MTVQVSSTSADAASHWSGGLAKLRRMRPPQDYAGVHIARWRQLIEDGDRFLDRWEREATGLGWNTLDLFGCSRVRPYARIDLSGLILLLDGRAVVELTATEAMIAELGRRHQRFIRRRPSPEQVALWELSH